MKNLSPFFILGLPRSRTAWLANWFTYGPSVCLHDPSMVAKDVGELARLLHDEMGNYPSAGYIGTSDSANVVWFWDLARCFPAARFLIVRRDVEQCIKSVEAQGLLEAAKTLLWAHASHELILQRMPERVRTLDFDDINATTMRAAHKWLTPGARFNLSRFKQLDEMVISPKMDKYKVKAWQHY